MNLHGLHDAAFDNFIKGEESRDICFSHPLTYGKRAVLEIPITELRAPDPKFSPGTYCTAFRWHDEMRLSVVHIPDDGESLSICWTVFPGWRTCERPAIITADGNNGADDRDARIAFTAYAQADVLGAFN